MKPTLKIEQFPDGEHEVPLVRSSTGETIGSAVVIFKDGLWNASLTLTVEGAEDLGVDLKIVHTVFRNGEDLKLVAKKNHEEWW
jgi:hypothetical protein